MRTTLKNEENVVLITRLHWIPTLMRSFIGLLALYIVGFFIGKYGYLLSMASVGLGACLVLAWKKNVWVVTNMRVVKESGLLSFTSKECPLDKINNVVYHQSFWGRIWGYGDVKIETAAVHGDAIYIGVKDPKKLKDTITTFQEQYRRTATILTAGQWLQQGQSNYSLSAELEKLFDLKQRGILNEAEFQELKTKMIRL